MKKLLVVGLALALSLVRTAAFADPSPLALQMDRATGQICANRNSSDTGCQAIGKMVNGVFVPNVNGAPLTVPSGLVKGNGASFGPAMPGADYVAPNGSGAGLTGITAAQVGAINKTGDTMTGPLGVPSAVLDGTQGLLGGLNGSNTAIPFGKVSGAGYGRLVPGTATRPGYVDFYDASSNRLGYAGYTDANGNLQLSGPWARDTQPGPAENGLGVATTALSQTRLSHVANNAALATWANTAFPVERDGFATPGDGGRARYTWSGAACSASDGGSQITATAGGCWRIDWSSVGSTATPQLFGYLGLGAASSVVDTAAIQAAINTGQRVKLTLTGAFYPSTEITQNLTGQDIGGDGIGVSIIQVQPAFANLGVAGVLFSSAPEPGPNLHDFSIQFVQPANPTQLSDLNQYPPCFSMEAVPRFGMTHVGCYRGINGVDMKKNTGGAILTDVRLGVFGTGFDIDGALDTLRFNDPQCFPTGFTAAQVPLAKSRVCFNVGRADDFKVQGGLAYQGTSFNFYQSAAGAVNANNGGFATGGIVNFDADLTNTGINMSAGVINWTGGYFACCGAQDHDVVMTGGSLTLANTTIGATAGGGGAASSVPAIVVDGGTSNANPTFTLVGSAIQADADDRTIIYVNAGRATVSGNAIRAYPGTSFTNAKITGSVSARLTAVGNTIGDKGAGSGVFINLLGDNYAKIIGNTSPGWTNNANGAAMANSATPTAGGSLYLGN